MTSPHAWSATRARRELSSGAIGHLEYLEACLAQIAAREDEVGAFIHLAAEPARAQAKALDAARSDGALAGIPFGIKDIIDTADMPTALGSPIHEGRRPQWDAACVALSRRAGGIALGKTVTTEFANIFPGKTRNPLDIARTPGGSSSGSAAAVAAGMVPLAFGTQTTASTIRPAAYCGLYGFIPSQGLVSCSGVRQSSWTLDRLGLFARTLEDIALANDVVRGAAVVPLARPKRAPRIAFCRTHLWDRLDPVTAGLLEDAADALRRAGARVDDVTLQAIHEETALAHRWISSFEFTRNYAYEIDHHFERISAPLREGRIADGQSCTFERYAASLATAARGRAAFDALMADHDLVLTVSASGEAPLGTATGDFAYCALWTALHAPCLTVPAFTGPSGMPIGLQLVGPRDGDVALLEAAAWVGERLGVG